MSPPALGVVVVLHRTDPTSSMALCTLDEHLRAHDEVHVIVHDNTENRAAPAVVPEVVDQYVTRPDNPGLAVAYTAAAEASAMCGAEWLMLLDQDTVVTRDHLEAVLAVVTGHVAVPDDVGVLVPTLRHEGRVISPHGRVRLATRPLAQRRPGRVEEWCTHLSSGSVLRLTAVHEIGGFPADYPLDYLDHVVAARLRSGGWRTWLLGSTLDHRLSLLEREQLTRPRLRSVLEAEERYHQAYGTRTDLAWLATRRWLGAGLSVAHLRRTPSAADEVAAAWRSSRAVLRQRTDARGG